MIDTVDELWDNFFDARTTDLYARFPGWYRAEVVETNDPLDHHRIRVKIPELHNSDIKTEDCPWAVPAPWIGGKGSGAWSHPIIGDDVFIVFEKSHPYAPIWCGFANPTRRKFYVHQSIYTPSPKAVKANGDEDDKPVEYEKDYLPKDGRPMSSGMHDRYGTFFMLGSVGFFPSEHKKTPTDPGVDGLTQGAFDSKGSAPQTNDPDCKMAVLETKYGHTFILGDQGYTWDKEFKGDFVDDKEFEIARSKYLVKFLNEQKPTGRDQRRIVHWTRYGHKFEMRDVGWDMSRDGEPGPGAKPVGDSQGRDERWVKVRTKAGMLLQGLDVGADPKQDTFIQNENFKEHGDQRDKEPSLGKDQRMWRMTTRHGNALFLDDRGTDPINGENETPHGNGAQLRSREFCLEFQDKPQADRMVFTTHTNQTLEYNAKFDAITMTNARDGKIFPTVEKPPVPHNTTELAMTRDPVGHVNTVCMDGRNKTIFILTPQQGIEFRDDGAPCGSWAEMRDNEDRGIWFSKKDQHAIIRDKTGQKYILLDDQEQVIVIRNEQKHVQIFAQMDVEIIAKRNICIKADKEIGIKAGTKIAFDAGGQQFIMDATGFGTKGIVQGQELKGMHPFFPAKQDCEGGGDDGGGCSQAPGAARGAEPCVPEPRKARRIKPDPLRKERACDPLLPQKGPIPPEVFSSPPGGGGGGGGGGNSGGDLPPQILPPSPTPIPPTVTPMPDPGPPSDPIGNFLDQPGSPNPGGVLWYGTTSLFQAAIEAGGLQVNSFINNMLVPPNKSGLFLQLAKSHDIAAGKKQAILAQRRYGGKTMLIRVRQVPDGKLLGADPDGELLQYRGGIPFDGFLEIYDIGPTDLAIKPLYQNVKV